MSNRAPVLHRGGHRPQRLGRPAPGAGPGRRVREHKQHAASPRRRPAALRVGPARVAARSVHEVHRPRRPPRPLAAPPGGGQSGRPLLTAAARLLDVVVLEFPRKRSVRRVAARRHQLDPGVPEAVALDAHPTQRRRPVQQKASPPREAARPPVSRECGRELVVVRLAAGVTVKTKGEEVVGAGTRNLPGWPEDSQPLAVQRAPVAGRHPQPRGRRLRGGAEQVAVRGGAQARRAVAQPAGLGATGGREEQDQEEQEGEQAHARAHQQQRSGDRRRGQGEVRRGVWRRGRRWARPARQGATGSAEASACCALWLLSAAFSVFLDAGVQ